MERHRINRGSGEEGPTSTTWTVLEDQISIHQRDRDPRDHRRGRRVLLIITDEDDGRFSKTYGPENPTPSTESGQMGPRSKQARTDSGWGDCEDRGSR